MKSVIVTLKSNVEQDEEGNIVLDEEGNFSLLDEKAIGIMLKTHAIQVTQVNPETQEAVIGLLCRSEVLWEHIRSPAPAFVDPSELLWLTLNDEAEEESEEYETDEVVEDENDYTEDDEGDGSSIQGSTFDS